MKLYVIEQQIVTESMLKLQYDYDRKAYLNILYWFCLWNKQEALFQLHFVQTVCCRIKLTFFSNNIYLFLKLGTYDKLAEKSLLHKNMMNEFKYLNNIYKCGALKSLSKSTKCRKKASITWRFQIWQKIWYPHLRKFSINLAVKVNFIISKINFKNFYNV
jgi:hypothetical protein